MLQLYKLTQKKLCTGIYTNVFISRCSKLKRVCDKCKLIDAPVLFKN